MRKFNPPTSQKDGRTGIFGDQQSCLSQESEEGLPVLRPPPSAPGKGNSTGKTRSSQEAFSREPLAWAGGIDMAGEELALTPDAAWMASPGEELALTPDAAWMASPCDGKSILGLSFSSLACSVGGCSQPRRSAADLGAGAGTPCCEAQGGGVWSVGQQESRSEKWGQRWHSGSPRLCGCSTWRKTEHPGLLQDPQLHLPPITPSCFTLGGEPLALFHDKPYCSITWWLSIWTKGRRPRSGS